MKKSSRDRRVVLRLITRAYKQGRIDGFNDFGKTIAVERVSEEFWNEFIGLNLPDDTEKIRTGRDWLMEVKGIQRF